MQAQAPEPVYELQTQVAPAASHHVGNRACGAVRSSQATIAAVHDVALTPVAPKAPQRIFNEPAIDELRKAIEQPREPQAFIPPQAERITRQVRMPDVSELAQAGTGATLRPALGRNPTRNGLG